MIAAEARCENGSLILDKPLPMPDGKVRIFVVEERPRLRREEFLSLISSSKASLGGWKWNREQLHDRQDAS